MAHFGAADRRVGRVPEDSGVPLYPVDLREMCTVESTFAVVAPEREPTWSGKAMWLKAVRKVQEVRLQALKVAAENAG